MSAHWLRRVDGRPLRRPRPLIRGRPPPGLEMPFAAVARRLAEAGILEKKSKTVSLSNLNILCTDGSTRKARREDAAKRIAFEEPSTGLWVLYEPGRAGTPKTTPDVDRAWRWTTAAPDGDPATAPAASAPPRK